MSYNYAVIVLKSEISELVQEADEISSRITSLLQEKEDKLLVAKELEEAIKKLSEGSHG